MLHGKLLVSTVRSTAVYAACDPANSPADRSLRVPAEEAQKSGLASDQVKINEKYGGGYPANIEGLHHLHCLVCSYYPGLTPIINKAVVLTNQ